jgi:hypothetical protein
MSLNHILQANPKPTTLELGWVNLAKLHSRVARIERSRQPLSDEQVLTYLCAYGYAIQPEGPRELARVLLGDNDLDYQGRLWFEFLPASPRVGEGETHLDLALGHVGKRGTTISGLEFVPPPAGPSWVAVVEAKLCRDISYEVDYDPFRNQLLRVIENAAVLSNGTRQYPDTTHVILLTPQVFNDRPGTRLYGYKFKEYCPNGRPNGDAIEADLGRLQLQQTTYRERIAERLRGLRLRWVTFEAVIRRMPPGPFRTDLLSLLSRERSLVASPS